MSLWKAISFTREGNRNLKAIVNTLKEWFKIVLILA
jgi:hypothetical protein